MLSLGRPIFSLAIAALGIETIVCARYVAQPLGPGYDAIPVLPWVPAIPWLAYGFGAIWVACAVGLLFSRTARPAAMVLASLLALCTLILIVPKSLADIGSVSLRTVVFEPLALASLACTQVLPRMSRYLLALSLIVFGVDHFISLAFIATLLPAWIPWHVFWVAFFGLAFIAAGLSIGRHFLERWGAALLALMFGIWVLTLHLPRVLGLYGIPDAPRNPNEWSSLFIALGLWGGLWALAHVPAHRSSVP